MSPASSCRVLACAATVCLCGCAIDGGIEQSQHRQLASMIDDFERELDEAAQPERVELLATDSLGRRMDRARRLQDVAVESGDASE